MRRIGKGLSTAAMAMVLMLSCSLLVFADTAYITTSDGGSVNMRAEASTDSDVVNFLDDGTEVEVLGTEGDWTQVSYDGYTGYVMSTFLTTEATDTASDTAADTEADTAADTTTEAAADTAAETESDTSADEATDDTTVSDTEEEEEEIEAETSDDEDTTLSEKLAKYKKLVMILALACLILVIIIINLLLFYRRGYDDDEYDEDDDEDDDEYDRYYEQPKRGRYEPEQRRQSEPVKQQDVDVPDISRMVNDTAAEAYGETSTPSIRPQSSAPVQDDDDSDLEFFDLDDL